MLSYVAACLFYGFLKSLSVKETNIFLVIKQIYHDRAGNFPDRDKFVEKYAKLNAC